MKILLKDDESAKIVWYVLEGKNVSDKLKGSLLLALAAMIWGSSFIVMKSAVDFLTPNVLLFVRFSLATVIMVIMFFKYVKDTTLKDLKGGMITGTCLFLAYLIQTLGLTMTTPGKNAFLTAVYCAIVPFLVWLFYHKRPDNYNFAAALLCIIGVGFVSLDGDLSMNMGDLLTLIGGFFYAFHILAIKKYSKQMHPIKLTTLQFAMTAILAFFGSLFFEDITLVKQINSNIILQIGYLAFFATAITLLCQNVGQHLVSECNAAILLSLESVFGVIFSVLLYGEVLSLKVVLGFTLIFIALIISETKLSFLKKNIKEAKLDV